MIQFLFGRSYTKLNLQLHVFSPAAKWVWSRWVNGNRFMASFDLQAIEYTEENGKA
jgi:hypothetical protein